MSFASKLGGYLPEHMISTLALEGTPHVDVTVLIYCTLFWGACLYAVKIVFGPLLFQSLFSFNDPRNARIPSTVPWDDPPGDTRNFDLQIGKADTKAVERFLAFRKARIPTGAGTATKRALAAIEALKYRNELLDTKIFSYFDENFTKNNKGVAYPSTMDCWSGTFGFWGEMGPSVRSFFLGNLAYSVQHGCSGIFAVAALYGGIPGGGMLGSLIERYLGITPLSIEDRWFIFNSAIYLDAGFNAADLILMAISKAIGKDLSLYSGPRTSAVAKGRVATDLGAIGGLFTLLIMHHAGALTMEVMGLYLGSEIELGCRMLIALLGITGCLHFFCVCMGYTPMKKLYPAAYFALHAFVLGTMLWFRGVDWIFVCYDGITMAYAKGGPFGVLGAGSGLVIFTLFNLDFIKHYFKVTKKAYRQMMEHQKDKTA